MPVEGQNPLRLVADPGERATRAAPGEAGRRGAGGPPDLPPDDEAPESGRDPDDGREETPAETGGRGRGAIRGAIVLLVLAAFAGAAWYAYNWGLGEVAPDTLPVIEAEPGPIKSRPESPGGMEVPYQDQAVLNDATPDPDRPQVERLLPPPETPTPPAPLQEQAASAPQEDEPVPAVPEASAEAPSETAAAEPQATTEAPEPAPEAAPEPTAESAPEATPEAAEVAPSAPAAGDWVVQLASLKSRDGVTAEWGRLQDKFPELLGPRALDIQSAEIEGQGTFHRLRVGYFADRAAAVAFCERLKAGGQDCLATRR